jgi:hypothetical protein
VSYSSIIIIASHLPIFFSAVYAAMIYRQLENELKVFSWFLFASAVLQLVSLVLWWQGISNMPVLHVYVPVSFLLLAWFYHTMLHGFLQKPVIAVAAFVFVVLSVLNSVYIQPVTTFNSYALTLESVLVIILSLSAYLLLLDARIIEAKRAQLKSINRINAGLLIYYSASLLIFYFGNLITHGYSKTFNRYTWIAHSFLSVMMYTLFITGLWKRQKK